MLYSLHNLISEELNKNYIVQQETFQISFFNVNKQVWLDTRKY